MWQLSGCCCESQHFVRCFCLPWLLLLLLVLCQVAALVANNISGHTFCFFLYFAFSSCLPYLNVIYVCRFTLLFLLLFLLLLLCATLNSQWAYCVLSLSLRSTHLYVLNVIVCVCRVDVCSGCVCGRYVCVVSVYV